MLFDRFRKKRKIDPRIDEWINKQSFPDDALTYLIEKEIYEHGTRDLSYIIPRKRNDEHFAQLLDRESHDARYKSNLAMYDSIATIHSPDQAEGHITTIKPKHHEPTKKTIETVGTIPASTYGKSLSSINKGRKIYNTTSSAVVVTAPEEHFHHEEADLSCFDD